MATIAITGDGFENWEMREAAKELRRLVYANVPDVSKVELFGVEEQRVFIEFDNVRVSQLGIDPNAVVDAIQTQNIILPGGRVEADGTTMMIEPSGDFGSVQDISGLSVRVEGENPTTVYLRDVADIRLGYKEPPDRPAFYNGAPAVVVSVSMIDNADAGRFGTALKAVVTCCSTVDRYADDIHYMGGCLLTDNFGWGAQMLAYQSRPPDPALRDDWRERWMERIETLPFLAARWPDRTWEYQAIKRVICLYIFATTMLIVWNNIPFDILTQIAGFLIANLAIAIMMVAAIYLNFKLPSAYRTRAWVLSGDVPSTAVPPASSIRAPIRDARQCWLVTTPPAARTAGLRMVQLSWTG